MLFGNKICEKCGSKYDVALETCPACKEHNQDFEKTTTSKAIVWLPILYQVLLFVIGWGGLTLLSIPGELIAIQFFDSDSVDYYMVVNVVRYAAIFISLAILLWRYLPYIFKKSFTKIAPYLLGLAGGVAMLAASMAYGSMINLLHPVTDNDNQTIATSMVSSYPIACIFLLGIIGPVVEEFTYRVGLFSFFCRINKYLAYAVTIVIFGLIHFDYSAFFSNNTDFLINELLNLPSYMIGGFLLSLWYDKWGLASSTTAHVFNNLFSIIVTIISGALAQ